MPKNKRKSYSIEFKTNAVKMILKEGISIADASRRLGVEYSVLRRWKLTYKKILTDTTSDYHAPKSEHHRIAMLQAELDKITEERNILLKALSHFVVQEK